MAGTYLSWSAFAEAWARVTGATIRYREVSFDDMVADTPDKDCGVEVALMYAYSSDPGYDGGMELLKAEDLRAVRPPSAARRPSTEEALVVGGSICSADFPESQAGIDCPMLTVEESLARQDWSAVLNK